MLNRRVFMRHGLSLAAGWAIPKLAFGGIDIDRRGLAVQEARRRLGAAWLRQPSSLRTTLPDVSRAAPSDWADAVRADFVAGRITVLDGWILSLTECALCVAACEAGDRA